MTTTSSPELSGSALIDRIRAGSIPREFLIHAANGFLPLPQEDLVAVLAYLADLEDEEVRPLARRSLSELPSSLILSVARDVNANPIAIGALADVSDDPAVLETLIRNRITPDDAIFRLASRVSPNLQEVIVINQERIIRTPEILDALLSNPAITIDIRRRALEVKEEFFEKRARIDELKAEEARLQQEADDLSLIADLLAKAEAEAATEAKILLSAEEQADPEKQSVFTKILLMSVSQRIQLGFKGSKTERMILIRDQNRLVCGAVMRNPRISESEVEAIAGMRNVNEEALRILSLRREWMSKYPIINALVKNPKTPIGVVLPLINRLTLRELKALRSDKNVSETIRGSARKLYEIRNKKQQ